MDVLAAYREVGTLPGSGRDLRHDPQDRQADRRAPRGRRGAAAGAKGRGPQLRRGAPSWSRRRSTRHAGRISAKRLLPAARAAGYAGSARNFRRLVAEVKAAVAAGQSPRPPPGGVDPGRHAGHRLGRARAALHVFCAVLAWSRVRFVRFAADEKAATTLALLAECFETLGGVPEDRAGRSDGLPEGRGGRQRGGPDPGLCPLRHRTTGSGRTSATAADPESKGIVENLVGYAKRDLIGPGRAPVAGRPRRGATPRPRRGATRSTPRCIPRSARCPPNGWPPSVELLGALPSLRPRARAEADHPQGRPAVLCAVRLGPLLGARTG